MSEIKETATTDEAQTTDTAAPAQNANTGPTTSNVVKTPDTAAPADEAKDAPDRGPTSLAVASSTAGAVTVLTGSVVAAAAGPVAAVAAGAVAAGAAAVVVVRRRRNRKAAGHRATDTGGSRRRVAGRRGSPLGGRSRSRRGSTRVAGLGRRGKGLGTGPKRPTGRTATKNAATKKRTPLGVTPRRGRGVTASPKGRRGSLGRALGKKTRSTAPTSRGRGTGRGTGGPGRGRGRGRSLLGGRSWFSGRGRGSNSPKGKGRGKGPTSKKNKKASSRTRPGFVRRVAGWGRRRFGAMSRWGGGHLRRVGWWFWGPRLNPTNDAPPVDDTSPDPADKKKTKGDKGKKRRKVNPNGHAPNPDTDPARPTSPYGPSSSGDVAMRFFQNTIEAIEADFLAMRNRFADPDHGGWNDTKAAMTALAGIFAALGSHGRSFAGETEDKGGYTAAFAEIVFQLSNHSTGVSDQCNEALMILRKAHGELVEYAENGRGKRFDQSKNQH